MLLLNSCFAAHGIEITGIASLLTAQFMTDAENAAVRSAWHDVRKALGVPGPKRMPPVEVKERVEGLGHVMVESDDDENFSDTLS